MAKELSEETLKEAFESADKDKDSQISVSELGMYLHQSCCWAFEAVNNSFKGPTTLSSFTAPKRLEGTHAADTF